MCGRAIQQPQAVVADYQPPSLTRFWRHQVGLSLVQGAVPGGLRRSSGRGAACSKPCTHQAKGSPRACACPIGVLHCNVVTASCSRRTCTNRTHVHSDYQSTKTLRVGSVRQRAGALSDASNRRRKSSRDRRRHGSQVCEAARYSRSDCRQHQHARHHQRWQGR